jgi:adenine/guanine phosphoribosyltransferase-like PRPP-binding protein
MKLANKNLPPPNATLHRLIKFFQRQGLDKVDLVALSGIVLAHLNAHFFFHKHIGKPSVIVLRRWKNVIQSATQRKGTCTQTPTTNTTDIFNAQK